MDAPVPCLCGCSISAHTIAAEDTGRAIWLCIACLAACPGVPRTVRGPEDALRVSALDPDEEESFEPGNPADYGYR